MGVLKFLFICGWIGWVGQGCAELLPLPLQFPQVLPELFPVSIGVGTTQACVLVAGEVWCGSGSLPWQPLPGGWKQQGDLPVALAQSSRHACVLTQAAESLGSYAATSVWCWGDNSHHQVVPDGMAVEALPQVPLPRLIFHQVPAAEPLALKLFPTASCLIWTRQEAASCWGQGWAPWAMKSQRGERALLEPVPGIPAAQIQVTREGPQEAWSLFQGKLRCGSQQVSEVWTDPRSYRLWAQEVLQEWAYHLQGQTVRPSQSPQRPLVGELFSLRYWSKEALPASLPAMSSNRESLFSVGELLLSFLEARAERYLEGRSGDLLLESWAGGGRYGCGQEKNGGRLLCVGEGLSTFVARGISSEALDSQQRMPRLWVQDDFSGALPPGRLPPLPRFKNRQGIPVLLFPLAQEDESFSFKTREQLSSKDWGGVDETVFFPDDPWGSAWWGGVRFFLFQFFSTFWQLSDFWQSAYQQGRLDFDFMPSLDALPDVEAMGNLAWKAFQRASKAVSQTLRSRWTLASQRRYTLYPGEDFLCWKAQPRELWCVGHNAQGALQSGHDAAPFFSQPMRPTWLASGEECLAVAAGGQSLCAVVRSGKAVRVQCEGALRFHWWVRPPSL